MKRHTPFAVPLNTRNLGAVQAARTHDLDALGAQTHCVLHRTLHGTAEHDPLLELLRDRIGNQLRIRFGLANLFDVHMHRHLQQALQVSLQDLDILALLADHHTRTGRENRDARILGRALDQHSANRRTAQLLAQIGADLDVLIEHARKIAAVGVPAR